MTLRLTHEVLHLSLRDPFRATDDHVRRRIEPRRLPFGRGVRITEHDEPTP